MPESLVHVAGRRTPLAIRFHGSKRDFHLATERIEAQSLTPLHPRYKDFLEIAATVFCADSTVRRGGPVRSEMGCGWRRGFRFVIPVRDRAFWSDPNVRARLTEAVHFLTDDDVTFEFVDFDGPVHEQQFLELDPHGAAFSADQVIMFSGGLDSFAGALETLATSNDNVLLVSHRSAQKVIPRQEALGEFLNGKFEGRVRQVHVMARRKGKEAADTNQRSRTLLFTAIGQAVAKAFGARRMCFFENGIVSHNLPISPQVVGTMATRTTHPLILAQLGKLVALLDDETVDIGNPYEWMTKTEVVTGIARHGANIGAPGKIELAVSCTSVRGQDALHTHCGACSQCLDRRFAILASGLEENDPPERYETDVMLGPRSTQRSRVLAVEWTRHMRRIGEMDQFALMTRYGSELSRIVIGHPELAGQAALAKCVDLYERQTSAVSIALRRALQLQAEKVIAKGLDETSLLGMHLGRDKMAAEPPPERISPVPEAEFAVDDIPEHDDTPHPDDPLKVSFFRETDGEPVVAVQPLCRVTGAQARIVHGLKPQFDEDRAEGIAHEEFKYVHPQSFPEPLKISKAAIRQHVKRCRETLASAFEEIHGCRPNGHLLIHSKQSKGYRLDPTIKIIARNRIKRD